MLCQYLESHRYRVALICRVHFGNQLPSDHLACSSHLRALLKIYYKIHLRSLSVVFDYKYRGEYIPQFLKLGGLDEQVL